MKPFLPIPYVHRYRDIVVLNSSLRDEGTGSGMARSSRISGVFERFCDGKEYEGTGIGLAIVWNIMHRHGGTVRMESAVDQECSCFFTIGGEE